MLETSESGLWLCCPKHVCARGHSIELEIRVTFPSGPTEVHLVLGKVEAVDPAEDGQDRVQLTVNGSSHENWTGFLQVFSDRQTEIAEFLANVKGYP